jgi:cytochrome P450
MLLDFEEHLHHRRIIQEAFTRTRLAGYVEHIDRVVTAVVVDSRKSVPRPRLRGAEGRDRVH